MLPVGSRATSTPPSECEPPRNVANGSAEPAAFSSAMIASTAAVERGVRCPGGHREVGRGRASGEPRVARRIEDDAADEVVRRSADERRVDQRRTGRVELRHVAVAVVERRVVRTRCDRPVGRRGAAGDVGVAGTVDGHAAAAVEVTAAEVGRVDERRTGRVELRQGRVEARRWPSCRTLPPWSGSRSSSRSRWRTHCRCRRP